jgi:hypothetical protein
LLIGVSLQVSSRNVLAEVVGATDPAGIVLLGGTTLKMKQ